jgi:hypothetical protein
VILSPKFSESLPLSFHAFIIVVYCILIDCVPHDKVILVWSNNSSCDFKTKSTRTSRVKYLKVHNSFFHSNKASVLEHIAPIYFSIYSVVVVLHVCVIECAPMIGLTRLDLSFLEALVLG